MVGKTYLSQSISVVLNFLESVFRYLCLSGQKAEADNAIYRLTVRNKL